MKSRSQSNALLMELLIVVMVFMLASTVLLQVFMKARSQSFQAGIIGDALNEAQNVADRLYTASGSEADTAALLKEIGFDFDAAGGSRLEREEYRLQVYRNTEDRQAGLMDLYQVQAYHGDELLLTLPVARYREATK